jgi:hypothetical protein
MIRSNCSSRWSWLLVVGAVSSLTYVVSTAMGSALAAKNYYCKADGPCPTGIIITLHTDGDATDGCTKSGSSCSGKCYGAAGTTSGMNRFCAAQEGSTCSSDTGLSEVDCGAKKEYGCASGKQGPSGCCNYDGQTGTDTGETAQIRTCT